ncbi:hypothetical protein COU57_05810 [Candidatus Pacearchaeota archaeon CG10_big_fil_rev_8_21_14_0_10_32_14]|nr:MAG: hypothetical protein COU57_05810 [Candidatus Pacearchaeota archaeon CG10_big_fil_rev_8_21_14_0_10_32_14]
MTDTKLLDSSVWIDYFYNGNHKEIIDGDELVLLSVISIYEIRKKLSLKNSVNKVELAMKKVKERSLIIPIDNEIAENGVEISMKHNLPMADSIIYATAQVHKGIVVTLDNHFRKLDKVIFID